MKKVGIITYHLAYNYGSALQALATQTVLKNINDDIEIINYRMLEQKKFYGLFRTKYGFKVLRNDFLQLPIIYAKMKKKARFEQFASTYFFLTEEFTEPEEISNKWDKYDIIVSGSDQIWNKQSCELKRNDWEHMMPYLLKGYSGRKVSYASSIGNMNNAQLEYIKPELAGFASMSMREVPTAKRLGALLNKEIPVVVDPTFLLTKEEWIDLLGLKRNLAEKYILYYSLGGMQEMKDRKKQILDLATKTGLKVKIVTPFIYYPIFTKKVESCPDYGPLEFLNALYNAEMVITDSYHGTVLSINFGKDVFSICKNGIGDYRKTDIISRLGLDNRIIQNIDQIMNPGHVSINYKATNDLLEKFREESFSYLKRAILN